MLKIINNLKPFVEDCYRRINVREYAALIKVSPPTASSLLESYSRRGLLHKEKDRQYLFYSANKHSKLFIDLARAYWSLKLAPLLAYIEKNTLTPAIILFGSLAKAEATVNSDVDLTIIAPKKDLTFAVWEKKLKRKIQVFWFNSFSEIKSKELLNNILNGYPLRGRIKL